MPVFFFFFIQLSFFSKCRNSWFLSMTWSWLRKKKYVQLGTSINPFFPFPVGSILKQTTLWIYVTIKSKCYHCVRPLKRQTRSLLHDILSFFAITIGDCITPLLQRHGFIRQATLEKQVHMKYISFWYTIGHNM